REASRVNLLRRRVYGSICRVARVPLAASFGWVPLAASFGYVSPGSVEPLAGFRHPGLDRWLAKPLLARVPGAELFAVRIDCTGEKVGFAAGAGCAGRTSQKKHGCERDAVNRVPHFSKIPALQGPRE